MAMMSTANKKRRRRQAVAAAAVAGDKLEGRWPPMRDYGDERQQRETAETADWWR